jgi:hypothetical protein
LAIRAYSGGNSRDGVIDTSYEFVDGDLLIFDVDKNLFIKGSNLNTLASTAYVTSAIAVAIGGNPVDLSLYSTTAQVAATIASLNSTQTVPWSRITSQPTIVSQAAITSEIATALAASPHFSGSWNDLVDKPIYFDGNYNNLTNQPTIPSIAGLASTTYVDTTIATELTSYDTSTEVDTKITAALVGGGVNLSNYITTTQLATALTAYTTTANITAAGYAVLNNLATVATTGSYNDLTNLPTPVNTANFVTTAAMTTALSAYQPIHDHSIYQLSASAFSGAYADLTGLPTLFTGSWNDLVDRPTIFDGNYNNLTNQPSLYTDAKVDLHLNQSNPTSGYVLSWNGTDYAWVAQTGGGGGGATSLGGLTDVSSTTPTTGYVLKWSGTEWAPAVDATTGSGGSNYATQAYVDQSIVAIGAHWSGDYNNLTNLPSLFSGSWTDLNNRPTTIAGYGITDSPNNLLDLNITDGTSGQVLTTDGNGTFTFTSAGAFNGDYNALVNLPTLFSGNYNDLANKPYIPSIAGLASTNYVDTKHAEATITGDKTFTGEVVFEDFIQQKVSTATSTAQNRDYVMAIQTTNAVETEALLSGAARIGVVAGTTGMFAVTFVATSTTDQASFTIKGIVNRHASAIALIGTTIRESITDASGGWTGSVTADTTNNALKITVTGEAAKTIDWTIFTQISEVIT